MNLGLGGATLWAPGCGSVSPRHRTPLRKTQMNKKIILALHGLSILGLLLVAIALATWRGALLPLDLGFSALITAGGFAILVLAWGPVWLIPLLASTALNRHWQRLLLWPVFLLAMVVLHGTSGPGRGFTALHQLTIPGALELYAVPIGLTLILGSALREAFRRQPQTRT